jgi:hypothetical protein
VLPASQAALCLRGSLSFVAMQAAIAAGVASYIGDDVIAALSVSYLSADCPATPPPALSAMITVASPPASEAPGAAADVAARLAGAATLGSAGATALAAALRSAGLGDALESAFTFFLFDALPPPAPSFPHGPPPPEAPARVSSLVLLSLLAVLLPIGCFLVARLAASRLRRGADAARAAAAAAAALPAAARAARAARQPGGALPARQPLLCGNAGGNRGRCCVLSRR